MYPAIYRASRLLWPGGGETHRHLRDLRASQWLSKTELAALQLRRLQHLVRHAYNNVPFYHDRYQQAGVHPDDVQTLADFERLPFVTREDVNQNLEAMLARNFTQSELFSNETGGSTGEPMRFFLEDSFWWRNAANGFRAREWYGVREGDRTAWFWGAQQDMPSWNWRRRLRSAVMQERYLNAFNMTQPAMRDFAAMLQEWRPLMFKGYASTLSLFARYIQEAGITGIRPRYIESTSEKLFTPQRELLESVFGCQVADHYSSREMGTIAYQCPEGGLHICADVRYLEIVANGQVAPPGVLGEVVLTALNQFAMPFIRYKNGDMGLSRADDCTCGRTLPLLQEIAGRTNDYLVSADGRFIHSEFFAYTFRIKPEVAQYQVHQANPAHLEVRIVCRQLVTDAWLEGVRAEIQTRFGPGTSISLQVVDQIALTPAGKHRYIISEVRPDFA